MLRGFRVYGSVGSVMTKPYRPSGRAGAEVKRDSELWNIVSHLHPEKPKSVISPAPTPGVCLVHSAYDMSLSI